MKAYHVDRCNLLIPGEIKLLNLEFQSREAREFVQRNFPEGISKAGHVYMDDVLLSDSISFFQRAKEMELEYIRKLYFSGKPSRFQSFFAVKSLEDVHTWIKAFGLNASSPFSVWLVDVENDQFIETCDAGWRDRTSADKDGASVYSIWETQAEGLAYWQGLPYEMPRPELVIPLTKCKVNVLEKITV